MAKRKAAHIPDPADAAQMDKWAAKARRNLHKGKSPRGGLTAEQIEKLTNRYSRFMDLRDDDGYLTMSEHVVTTLRTPRPFLHLLTSNHDNEFGIYGSFWDQTGLGFACYDSVLAGAVTSHKDASYVPTSPRSTDVRLFYLREETKAGDADIWFMVPQIGRGEEEYSDVLCRQGLGYSVYESQRNKIATSLRVFVAVDDPCEVWTITLTNTSRRKRTLKLFPKLNWGLETHPGYYFDPRVCSEGVCEKDLNAIVAFNRDKSNNLPRTGFMMADAKFAGFDLSNDAFDGGGYFRPWPAAVEAGKCTNSLGLQPYLGLCGAMQFNVTLAAGASKTINIVVGNCSEPRKDYAKQLAKLRKKLLAPGGAEKEFARVCASWGRMLSAASVECPDEEINRAYNVWLKYQQRSTSRWIRALDQVGYRDILQDMLGICNFDPDFVRNHLPRVLNYQLRDGRAIRQFFKYPDTKAPNDERMYADSPLWIADTLVTYVEETGDFSILDVKVGYYDLDKHARDETHKESVYVHAKKGIVNAYETRGRHGLCLVGHGDWNDAVDGLAREGKGVSVWLSMCLIFAAERFRKLAAHLKDAATVEKMDDVIRTMTRNVNKGGWDGDHYIFGYDDRGRPVGSKVNDEGATHMAVNAWAWVSGVGAAAGRDDLLEKNIEHMHTVLGYITLDKGYTAKSRELVGRIADMAAGQFENAAIYTHAVSFAAYGLARRGRGADAIDELKRAMPDNTLPDITTAPTHQQSNFTVGREHPEFGKNLYNNFSGSTAWFLKTMDACFGVLADFDGLRIAPSVPKAWKKYRLRKRFRGVEFHFDFQNAAGKSKLKSVEVNGKPVALAADGTCFLPIADFKSKKKVTVRVVM